MRTRSRSTSRKNSLNEHSNQRRVGLARALSKLGYCSRSRAGVLIQEGRVLLNGAIRRDPETPMRPGADEIFVDGRRIAAAKKIYLALNKPRGVVTTASDEKNRKTVYDLLSENLPWVGPVGRLDQASEGLLLLTNDSGWANRITAPETHLDKTYHVQVSSVVEENLPDLLKRGLKEAEGDLLRAKRAAILRRGERNTWLEIVLDEGKNRQIRRMLDALGIEVLRLIRVAIGPLSLGDLPKGNSRELTDSEKQSLDRAIAQRQRN